MQWQRRDGWPGQVAQALAWLGAAGLIIALVCITSWYSKAPKYPERAFAPSALLFGLAFSLSLWRRGVTLDKATQTMTRWWGIAVWPGRTLQLRQLECRSVSGYPMVCIESCPEHYKRWPSMYAVRLRQEGSLVSLVLDDEFRSQDQARPIAERVARYLGLELRA